ncbi:4-hydroxyphenylpyruvate dioxygenase [Azospirillum doebereinerae]|uniref:4-hydroxyphenylpyruvate dioxygenase n=1 Tax=Azospirillum doebereinerae TaxID=92933 RepID=A0A3S0V6I0_9PROT|nr:4-hydroxyphenylpyruvate dioxygenase [Azospirillum doebereinerae]MCG5239920.1 4-hydroxyphenylpyruvate dioxygenase [Azospirillum doebereinerae]RUQ70850.1 4-hydroxyphenylpyruvate dioxygenase [Azospirillum doebereinerae]
MGTDGFEFVEYASTEPEKLGALFETMGFAAVARHRSKNVTLYRQGDVNFIVNAEPDSFARRFAEAHGPCACAMAFRVADAKHAFDRAVSLGAKPVPNPVGPMELNIPAIEGIGGSLLYFVDRYGDNGSIYDVDFRWAGAREAHPEGVGLHTIDHLTHNVQRGNMAVWAGFYERLFNFRQIRYFDIEGKFTGLFSKALTSPDGKIRIPINESADDKSQIEEYLRDYKGEGIQHVALETDDIYDTVDRLGRNGLDFMPAPPDAYYAKVEDRLPGHGEPLERLREYGLLIDGGGVVEGKDTKLLLQIFSKTVIGPIFFEFIQRKGDDGFGEGNFKALFESIEADQLNRGVIGPAA